MTAAGKRLAELRRRRAQRDKPAEVIQPDPGPDLDARAELVAGLRALADFLEQRPEVPCPQAAEVMHVVLAKHTAEGESLPLPDDVQIAAVREIAALLDVPPHIEGTRAFLEYSFGGDVTYCMYAKLTD